MGAFHFVYLPLTMFLLIQPPT